MIKTAIQNVQMTLNSKKTTQSKNLEQTPQQRSYQGIANLNNQIPPHT